MYIILLSLSPFLSYNNVIWETTQINTASRGFIVRNEKEKKMFLKEKNSIGRGDIMKKMFCLYRDH